MTPKKQVTSCERIPVVRALLIAGCAALLAAMPLPARAADPTAQELLQNVRLNQGARHCVLNGQLRYEDKISPFRLVLNGTEIRYEFTKPDQTFVLTLADKTSRLDELTKNGATPVGRSRFQEPVRGTDVTCEDLALRFLYWRDAKIIGEDPIGGVQYYMIELHPDPGANSQYTKVVAWVAKKFDGVLAKAKCYAGNDRQPVAVMTVKSSQTLPDGARFLKQMTVERMANGKPIRSEPTYLEILGEEK